MRLKEEIEALLGESEEHAIQREQTAFAELASPFEERLVLFGAGNLGRRTLAGLRAGGRGAVAFADNNPDLWGKAVMGLPVFSLRQAIEQFGRQAAFVVCVWRGEGDERLEKLVSHLLEQGCSRVVPFAPLFWRDSELFLPHYAQDLPHKVIRAKDSVLAAFELFTDQASRREYVAQVRMRLLGDWSALPDPVAHPIYFPADLVALRADEVFVDCGAYDGDSIASFLEECQGVFDGVHAFEPDPANFRKLEAFRSNLPTATAARIGLYQAATGRAAGRLAFDALGTGSSHLGSGSQEVDCTTLDQVLEGRHPSYIKLDIEGAEPDALTGASECIRSDRPVLAVCVYHAQDHLWNIPLQINALLPEAQLFLRPHVRGGWDLVCYAIPRERLIQSTGKHAAVRPRRQPTRVVPTPPAQG